MNIEKLIYKIPEGNSTAIETLKATYPDEFREFEAKQWFKNDILNKLVKKVDKIKYPNWVFYFINDKKIFDFDYHQNGKINFVWVSYRNCWENFEKKFHYNYRETETLIKNMVEEYFKMKITPVRGSYYYDKIFIP